MIVEKLERLGVKSFGVALRPSCNNAKIRVFEAKIGTLLPVDYREFLSKYGTALLFKEFVSFAPIEHSPWDDENGLQDIEMFYGLNEGTKNLIRKTETYCGRIPRTMISIAEAPGDNQICLGISGDERGKVYFWDKDDEREITGDRVNDFGNLYLIADSFSEFVESLFVAEDEPIDPAEYEDDGESWILEDY